MMTSTVGWFLRIKSSGAFSIQKEVLPPQLTTFNTTVKHMQRAKVCGIMKDIYLFQNLATPFRIYAVFGGVGSCHEFS